SFEALKYDVARLRSYTSNSALLQPTAAKSSFLQSLPSGPNATDPPRRIATGLQTALTATNFPVTMQLLQTSDGQFDAPSRKYNWTTRLDYNRNERDFISGRFTLAKEHN